MTKHDTALGDLFLHPWYDAAAIRLLSGVFFPLGRAWAAAEVAGLDVDRFIAETDGQDRSGFLVRRALAAAERRRRNHSAAADIWLSAMFDGPDPGDLARAEVEVRRERTAFRYMATRASFLGLHTLTRFPKVRIDVPGPEEARARHGARLGAADAFGPLSDPETFERSRPVATDLGSVTWLRGPPDATGDRPSARVTVAPGGERRPVLVLSHGISMEDEHWGLSARAGTSCLDAGLTLIQPEGPGHGRRRRVGRYGGEAVFGCGPVGMMDYFFEHVRELGTYVAWARETFDAPVAVGGISLGALSAQLASTAAHAWPERFRPDGVFLVTPSPDLRAVAFQGRLTQALNLIAPLRHAGWTEDAVGDWLSLLEPHGEPVTAPEKIVCLLGEADNVTPHATGVDLVRRWRVPALNVFTRPSGHFTTALSLTRDTAPLARVADVLSRA